MSQDEHPLQSTAITESNVPLLEGLTTTRAIRRYRDEPIPEAHLRDMLFAATRAPSGSNRQPFRFIVLTDSANAHKAKSLIAG
jgi:nitroreductase